MPRILLVEDERNIRLWLSIALRKIGYELVEAEDGLAAWNILSTDAQFDLILTDLRMPNMDGVQLAQRVSEHFPRIPLLFTCARSDPGFGMVGSSQYPHLVKPISHQQLVETVQQVIGQSKA
jgi:CheY-like chemotaxis protein